MKLHEKIIIYSGITLGILGILGIVLRIFGLI